MCNRFSLLILIFLAATSAISQTTRLERDAQLRKFETPDHRIQDVAFSADGRMVAAGYGFYDEGGVTIWDIPTRRVVATLLNKESKKGGINKIAFSNDGKLFAAADSNGNTWLWKVGHWQDTKRILTGKGDSNGLVFSPDSTKLALTSDKTALIYDLSSNKTNVIGLSKTDFEEFDGISFTPNGQSVVVSGTRGTLIWDVPSGQVINKWQNPAFNFFGQLSPDGRYFIYGGGAIYGEKSVNIHTFPDGKEFKELKDFKGGIFALAISNSGKYFALAGGDYGGEGTFSLWSFEGTKELGFGTFGDSPVQGLAFSSDDKMFAIGSDNGYVLIFDTDKFRGNEIERQTVQLCGEIQSANGKILITPISKIPGIMSQEFVYPWRLEIADPDSVRDSLGLPVVLQDWAIESSSARDRARIDRSRSFLTNDYDTKNYIVFGVGENPGVGYVIKIFANGNFVATDRSGKCLSYGDLSQFQTNYASVKQRLFDENFLAIPPSPLTIGADHFRTTFIEITTDGVSEIRSDADSFELIMKQKGATAKRKAFSAVYTKEQAFIDSLLQAGFR